MARPEKIDKESKKAILLMVAYGTPVNEICETLGIDESTYYRKLERDKEFAREVKRAKNHVINKARETLYKNIHDPVVASKILAMDIKRRESRNRYQLEKRASFEDMSAEELQRIIDLPIE
jgi:hypothetical protein